MRPFKLLTSQEKAWIYELSRDGISDEDLCDKFELEEDELLVVFDEVHVAIQRSKGYQKIYITRNTKKG